MSQIFEEIEPTEEDLAEVEEEQPRSVAVVFGLLAGFIERDSSWMERSACVGTDPEAFFPGKGGSGKRVGKKVCGPCPVRQQCAEHVMAVETPKYRFGTWGGMSPNDRHRLAGTGPRALLSD